MIRARLEPVGSVRVRAMCDCGGEYIHLKAPTGWHAADHMCRQCHKIVPLDRAYPYIRHEPT